MADHQSRRVFLLFAMMAGVLMLLLVAAVSRMLMPDPGPAEHPHVAILVAKGIDDQSWGSLAYESKQTVLNEFDISASIHPFMKEGDVLTNTKAVLEEEAPSLMIGHGREFSDVFTELAKDHAQRHFVTLHGHQTHENQTVYTFSPIELDYFVGILMAWKTESGKVGVIFPGEHDVAKRTALLAKGAESQGTNLNVLKRIVADREDGDGAVEAFRELKEEGADIVYALGNSFNQRVIEQSIETGTYMVGYLDDQSYMARDLVLTSVVNDVPNVYKAIVRDYIQGEMNSGIVELTIEDDVMGFSELGPMFDADERMQFQYLIDRYREGNLPVPDPEVD
ncbi:BMP family ABC transporter substrate-binding protein [Salisediminibacterium selenitireducens]|uniref:Basic membrane lipoprotein n=1 Tax=Bacillus selenitireducens (strain ATCC 700615 / DSM 15326 / MLS10) TaxID=439292 RepID=D6Y0D6_BACIE|nr:BMP family ABC transporter substrate-binding protein [Salisediminibacterium selenitireducens]ADH98527.1 basic membrane lipoprotein [[Bacillus] selenitireducens MLS10]